MKGSCNTMLLCLLKPISSLPNIWFVVPCVVSLSSIHGWQHLIFKKTNCNPPYGKKWQLYILPQYFENLTQPIGTQKAIFCFCGIWPYTNNIVYARCGVLRTFLCVFMSVSCRVFERLELWVNVPVAIVFVMVDWLAEQLLRNGVSINFVSADLFGFVRKLSNQGSRVGAVSERSPPTNVVRVRFPDSASYVG